jgi:hypothetical protein
MTRAKFDNLGPALKMKAEHSPETLVYIKKKHDLRATSLLIESVVCKTKITSGKTKKF